MQYDETFKHRYCTPVYLESDSEWCLVLQLAVEWSFYDQGWKRGAADLEVESVMVLVSDGVIKRRHLRWSKGIDLDVDKWWQIEFQNGMSIDQVWVSERHTILNQEAY